MLVNEWMPDSTVLVSEHNVHEAEIRVDLKILFNELIIDLFNLKRFTTKIMLIFYFLSRKVICDR